MKTFWSYVSTFLSGVIAGLVMFFKLKDPEQVVNIGKVKQRGEGNDLSDVLDIAPGKTRKEIRKERRSMRKAKREARRAEKEKKEFMEE